MPFLVLFFIYFWNASSIVLLYCALVFADAHLPCLRAYQKSAVAAVVRAKK